MEQEDGCRSRVAVPRRAVADSPGDCVATALEPLSSEDIVEVSGATEMRVVARGDIPAGHKIAIRGIGSGEVVRKFGLPIGRATQPVRQGEWVHRHNLATLSGQAPGEGR